jgi:fructose-bisphosphate aldolase class I
VIASFSRALVDDLHRSMGDPTFQATIANAIDEIHGASMQKLST